MTARLVSDYLADMLEAATRAVEFTHGLTPAQFADDPKTAYAVARALEILGEAAKNVPQDIRDAYPHIPWREMAGMRDKLIHGYFGVNPGSVWQTAAEDLPPLLPALHALAEDLRNA
jgi:uncharacterized protein with HEPN domain